MVHLSGFDLSVIIGFLLLILGIGFYAARQAGKNTDNFFLGGRNMPWWLLGFSMVATTFSTDTPNLVTDIVRQNGVSGNWVWWIFLLTGMLTVFVYARLWRKSDIKTDIEFYELRYSGPAARFLRGFRAVYLGMFFNVLAMAGVILAGVKIGEIMLGWPGWQTVLVAGGITVVFSTLGGFRGVVLTDFILFIVAMIGAFGAAYIAVQHPSVGGLTELINHPNVADKLNIIPSFKNKGDWITLALIPLAVQWWASWYPGAEPGGGGYIAQRMLAAKNEKHAVAATLFFNIAHYALRPWPWIIVALASLVVFPDMASIAEQFPNVSPDRLKDDIAYPAMLTFLPNGFLGLVVASLIAAFMSTISTHLNWGSSYLVNDFYKRFMDEDASEKKLVLVGRIFTIIIMIIASIVGLYTDNAKKLFDFIILFGAGTGLIFILRWFWWRINAWSEISAMFASGIVAITVNQMDVFTINGVDYKFPFAVLITTIVWLIVTYFTRPTDKETLEAFYDKIQPGGPGWAKFRPKTYKQDFAIVKLGISAMIAACLFVYGALIGFGYLIYQQFGAAMLSLTISLICGLLVYRIWTKMEPKF